jgi:uncharacterized protein
MIQDPPPLRVVRPAPKPAWAYHTMIKPSGAQCNLDCAYCFYLHKEDLLAQPRAPRMSDAVLEAHIRQYIDSQSGPQVVFTWQGGEPTLMGLDFFRRAVALQATYSKPGQAVENDLQTNGVLLDQDWCDFLKANAFLVGLSIDGPAELHDAYRRAKGGQPTFERVMQAADLLRANGIAFNALCVVNRQNARRPIDVYRFLRDRVRPRMIQFIPGLEPTDFRSRAPGAPADRPAPKLGEPQAKPGAPDSIVADWSVDPDDWGDFLCRVWDEWFARDYGRVFVDQFENIVSMMFGQGPQKCVNARTCGRGLAVEHDGELFSCDHFVYPEHRLGNILETPEGDLARSQAQVRFGLAKHETLPAYCRSCRHLELCWGECPKNRLIRTPQGEPGLNYLCSGLKAFYDKATAARPELARRLGPI